MNIVSNVLNGPDIEYRSAIWSYQPLSQERNVLRLTVGDVNHLTQIYKKFRITPETLKKVSVEFLLQRERLSRYIIKEIDTLLEVGGLLEVVIIDSKAHSTYTRSKDQVRYEIAVSTNGRYRKVEEIKFEDEKLLRMSYQKMSSRLPADDTIDKWSFGIASNGKKSNQVDRLVKSIVRQNIPEYEIIICGPNVTIETGANIKHINDVINNDIRAPICAKKNKIISSAKYNNICILHDRFTLPDDWYRMFQFYGNMFDFLCLPTVNDAGQRFGVDWMTFCEPITKRCSFKNFFRSYSKWSDHQIIQGGVILGKKHLISNHHLDERLHWEELEDIHFSKMICLNGSFIGVDINNKFVSEAVNHRPISWVSGDFSVIDKLNQFRSLSSNFIRYYYYKKKYYSSKAVAKKSLGGHNA